MVLAGPGSGKTLVITYRVKWLIENAGVHPSNILVITFTRAAAEEMRKRFFAFDGMENVITNIFDGCTPAFSISHFTR